MKLYHLLEGYPCTLLQGTWDRNVTGVWFDSRQVSPDGLFVCLPGSVTDGHDHIPCALANGAAALVVDRPVRGLPPGVTVILTARAREALAFVSDKFWGSPSARLKLFGITGSRGKTATAAWLLAMCSQLGLKTGLIGSCGAFYYNEVLPVSTSTRTTPEAPALQHMLYLMQSLGAQSAILEVTSHALALDRVAYCRFETGLFTNLYPAHLDFHGTLENYRAEKLKLFDRCRHTVVNRDDETATLILADHPDAVTYAMHRPADVMAEDIDVVSAGVSFTLRYFDRRTPVTLPCREPILVYNFLAAAAAVCTLGLPAMDALPQLCENVGRDCA